MFVLEWTRLDIWEEVFRIIQADVLLSNMYNCGYYRIVYFSICKNILSYLNIKLKSGFPKIDYNLIHSPDRTTLNTRTCDNILKINFNHKIFKYRNVLLSKTKLN